MSSLFMQQRFFSFNDSYAVYDENETEKYYVEGKILSFGKKLSILDRGGNEIARVAERVFSFLPVFEVYAGDRLITTIQKDFQIFNFSPSYSLDNGFHIQGDLFGHNYELLVNGQPIMTIQKAWFSFTDCFQLDILREEDEIVALAIALAIDCVMDRQDDHHFH